MRFTSAELGAYVAPELPRTENLAAQFVDTQALATQRDKTEAFS